MRTHVLGYCSHPSPVASKTFRMIISVQWGKGHIPILVTEIQSNYSITSPVTLQLQRLKFNFKFCVLLQKT